MNGDLGMNSKVSSLLKEMVGLSLLGLFLFFFFFLDFINVQKLHISKDWLNVNTIFLSIILEAIPFILLGVFASALIQIFVSEETIQRYIPKNPVAALISAAILGAIFPICECAIVPVVRRLIKKGVPLHVGVVFLIAAPILNPVVFASTYYAFRTNLEVVYARMGLAFVLSIVIGGIIYIIYRSKNQLRSTKEVETHSITCHSSEKRNRLKETVYHASDEFFDMGKYLIIGAFFASLFQTFLDRDILLSLGSNVATSPLVMMGFAYVLSLCSEADAFVASSFGSTFTVGSIIAFLVYGPMIDMKNTLMLFAYFKTRFVVGFIIVVTIVVYVAIQLLQLFML